MKTKLRPSTSFNLILRCSMTGGALILLACAWPIAARAQYPSGLTGTFSASETWTVTIAEDNGETPTFSKTYHGTATGTLTVTNGNYALIDRTGLPGGIPGAELRTRHTAYGGSKTSPVLPKTWRTPTLNVGRTIYSSDGGWEVDGDYPVAGFAGNYAIVELSFFIVKVELPVTDFAIPALNGGGNDVYTTTGDTLDSLSGWGDESDSNTGFTASASSTSSLNSVAAPGVVAPSITTQPRSQSVPLGASPLLTVAAAGTEPLSYQWTHDGTNLVDAGEFSGSATAALTIDGVQAADAGNYAVIVSNAKGSVKSAAATLMVGALFNLEINGQGTVTPDYDGQVLPTGRSCKITAKPETGYSFAGWTGSIVANTLELAFTVETNMALVANFVPNPFVQEQGIFNGLFLDTNDVTEASSGFFTLALTTSGAFTGKIMTSGGTYSLPTTTKFNLRGQVEFTVPTKQDTLAFNLQLDLSDPASQQITGTVSYGAWTAGLTADRAVFNATTNKANNYEGLYTLAIAGSEDAAASPGGFGWATLSISPAGLITMVGNLADGTAMSQSVSVSKDGRWPFYAAYPPPPAGNGGAVVGWLTFSNQSASALGGTLYWFRPAGKTPALYQNGFTNLGVQVIGSGYNPAGKPLLALTTGQVTLDGGNLPFAITNQISLAANNIINVPAAPENTNKLALTISTKTGAISGSFANPSDPKQTIKVNGVLLQNRTTATGYFLGSRQSGAFLLENP